MPTAAQFYDAFLKQYGESRKSYSDEEWNIIWTDTNRWSNLMIYRNDSVIRKIAPRLNLQCYDREPLHLDATFTIPDQNGQQLWDWFPIIVALEHENDHRGFHGEINKLFSICCPLKVGITYALLDERKAPHEIQNTTLEKIRKSYINRNNLTKEDPETEYLFLIGIEYSPRVLRWSALMFRADQGPEEAGFAN